MKAIKLITFVFLSTGFCFGQLLPPKQASPLNVKQIHSGHSLTDPLFYPHWPGQYVNLVGVINSLPSWSLFDDMVGKSTIPGSSLNYRWNNPVGFGAPDARLGIANWELLTITERVPLNYEGGNTQQWYLDGIREQKEYLSLFVNNAWTNGNKGNGTPTLLWTTWTNLDNSNGPWRQMLDIQGEEFERMQDYANANRPNGAPHVYLIPGHKMMARLHDDIQLNRVPGITSINQFFGDNIHTNELGAYAISMIHYACIFNKSPEGLTNNLLPNAPQGTLVPSPALALYLQKMIWDVVTNYPRTGIINTTSSLSDSIVRDTKIAIYPNPVTDYLIMIRDESEKNEPFFIFNCVGQIVCQGFEDKVDVSMLPVGLYFLKVGNFSKKFLKQ